MLDILIDRPEEKTIKKGILKISDRADKPVKSFIKSVSWRIVGTLDTMVISYFITGKLTIALSLLNRQCRSDYKDDPLLLSRKVMGTYSQVKNKHIKKIK